METTEREAYRKSCKHYIPTNEVCRGFSRYGRRFICAVHCTENSMCRRMLKYDNEHQEV